MNTMTLSLARAPRSGQPQGARLGHSSFRGTPLPVGSSRSGAPRAPPAPRAAAICAVRSRRAPARACALVQPAPTPLGARTPLGATRAPRESGAVRLARAPGALGGGPEPESEAAVVEYDFLVLGSGIAGLSYALAMAEHGRVAVITKDTRSEGCTQYAQGGVCAVLDEIDSVESHVQDTCVAGAFLNDVNAVSVVCGEGPARVKELIELGAEFTRNQDGSLHLTREGGHTNRRIVHADDVTGREIQRALVAAAGAHPHITFYEHHLAVDLLTEDVEGRPHCLGADVLDQRTNKMTRFLGLSTMLATGGAGCMYPHTTNPDVTTGDGIAMAFRAGAKVANMEFVQFHPTSFYDPDMPGRSFLITEAVRGEGGMLYNVHGERFMSAYDDRLELAPRDVVARAIQDQMRRTGEPHVMLDISHRGEDFVRGHFPNITAHCLERGVDITREPIPVVPAQHYLCGGVKTGLRGETDVQGLFACGEVTCTGLHGANRLASNSLLEGLVFSSRAVGPSAAHAEHARSAASAAFAAAAASADFVGPRAAQPLPPPAMAWVDARRARVQELMWEHVGIVRTEAGLSECLAELASLYGEVRAVYKTCGYSTPLAELMNIVTCAELVAFGALQRRESRGLHYCTDYPEPAPRPIAPFETNKARLQATLAVPAGSNSAAGGRGASKSAGAGAGKSGKTRGLPAGFSAPPPVDRKRSLSMRAEAQRAEGERRRTNKKAGEP